MNDIILEKINELNKILAELKELKCPIFYTYDDGDIEEAEEFGVVDYYHGVTLW